MLLNLCKNMNLQPQERYRSRRHIPPFNLHLLPQVQPQQHYPVQARLRQPNDILPILVPLNHNLILQDQVIVPVEAIEAREDRD